MKSLIRTLGDSDRGLLPIFAQFWDVPHEALEPDELVSALNSAMLNPARAETVFRALSDQQRGALQHLLGSGGRMPAGKYTRLHGEIRHSGTARLAEFAQRPASPAEALFYRGLIAQTFEQSDTGPRPVLYVPDDLVDVLPAHITAPAAPDSAALPGLQALPQVENPRPADTAIVDDMTTLLAWLQLHGAPLQGDELAPDACAALAPYLLAPDPARLRFLVGLAFVAGLIAPADDRAALNREPARHWLAESRPAQLRHLAEAWRRSAALRDLWHLPGLAPEADSLAGYDPTVARGAVLNFIGELAPAADWWSPAGLVAAVKQADPDFQRPGADYDSWYIRDSSGDYLRGFDSWDRVEGALIAWLIHGPLHWLGMLALADSAACLSAWGRAFLELAAWPAPAESPTEIELGLDGVLRVPRSLSRLDRFQLARFTSWQPAADPFIYHLDGPGIDQAWRQGIRAGHISAFLSRVSGRRPLPPGVSRLLQNWQDGPRAHVTLEQQLLLRTDSPAALTTLYDSPDLRRFLGARLGPAAALVRAELWPELRQALAEAGIQVDLHNLE